LVDEVGSGRVGLNVDTGNFAWGGHDPEQTCRDLEAALPKAVNVHFKDVVWVGDGTRFVAAGTGSIGISELMRQLDEQAYTGSVRSDYEGSDPPSGGDEAKHWLSP
jgi:sugar phosphate isomerase/epimerase